MVAEQTICAALRPKEGKEKRGQILLLHCCDCAVTKGMCTSSPLTSHVRCWYFSEFLYQKFHQCTELSRSGHGTDAALWSVYAFGVCIFFLSSGSPSFPLISGLPSSDVWLLLGPFAHYFLFEFTGIPRCSAEQHFDISASVLPWLDSCKHVYLAYLLPSCLLKIRSSFP